MKETLKLPFYAKLSLMSVGILTATFMLDIAQHIIVPIIYSIILAVVLSPVVQFLIKKKMSRAFAISTTLLVLTLILFSFVGLLSTQLNEFTEALPKLTETFYELINSFIAWTSGSFDISSKNIYGYIEDTKTQIISGSRSSIAVTLSSVSNALVIIVLIPVYVFMILYYQPLLLSFIRRLFSENEQKQVNEVLSSTKTILQKYLVALLIEAGIIAALNSIGLYVIGIKYAVVLGIIGAILNVIPYLGGIIAMALYMIVALVTKDSYSYMLYVLILYSFIQLIDNNLIVPKLVGSKVKINALVSIIAVIAGGALWGIAGMFISLPLTAIAKLIFDRVEPLKSWGFLLGDTMPTITIFKIK